MPRYPYRIIFIRHGETDYNRDGRLQGQRDIPLNGKGREQAAAVGRSLAKLARSEIDALEAANAFAASPLSRTRETMEIARAAMGLSPAGYAVSDELKELSFGEWEGWTWEEVWTRAPELARAREKDKWHFVPPGGESYAEVAERISAWLQTQNRDLFITSHGGVARAMMRALGGLDPQRATGADIYQGRALVFEADGTFRWVG